MKKTIPFTEHILIPLVLAILHIAIVHLLYLFAQQGSARSGQAIPVALSLVLLAAGIISKKKWLLVASVGCYLAVCCWAFM